MWKGPKNICAIAHVTGGETKPERTAWPKAELTLEFGL